MNIKVLKLVTGEEMISQIKDTLNPDEVILVEPQKFVMTEEGVGSMPLMPMSKDKEYKISKNHIILISEPDDNIRNVYNSKYGSGIVLPSTNLRG
jgi:hypothetical protein